MLNRSLHGTLLNAIESRPAVALVGARQVGKTTLARTIAQQVDSVYVDLQNPKELMRLNDPLGFFSDHSEQLVILDEIQQTPEIFPILRGVIDEYRWRGRKAGHFLLLGSASMRLLRQTSESLAGRISYLELGGLNILEIEDTRVAHNSRWLKGGFPESYLASSDESGMNWLEDLITTYLLRDIPLLAFPIPANRLRRLWTMLAHLQGEVINYSKLAGNLEVDGKTVSRYVDTLVDLLLVRRLLPWHENTKKRLIKSPRHYIRDSGILHQLLDIASYDSLLSHPVLGKSWEGFVIDNILSILPTHAKPYFYKTSAGAEIDLIIRFAYDDIWAIEVKFGNTPKVSKVFSRTCEDVGATFKFIVYGGDDEFSVGDGVTIISLPRLMRRIIG